MFLSIKKDLYNGVPVTTLSPEAKEPPPGDCPSRLQRCFITGAKKQDVRQVLRVIAGVRRKAGDPGVITEGQLATCLAECPERSRCGC